MKALGTPMHFVLLALLAVAIQQESALANPLLGHFLKADQARAHWLRQSKRPSKNMKIRTRRPVPRRVYNTAPSETTTTDPAYYDEPVVALAENVVPGWEEVCSLSTDDKPWLTECNGKCHPYFCGLTMPLTELKEGVRGEAPRCLLIQAGHKTGIHFIRSVYEGINRRLSDATPWFATSLISEQDWRQQLSTACSGPQARTYFLRNGLFLSNATYIAQETGIPADSLVRVLYVRPFTTIVQSSFAYHAYGHEGDLPFMQRPVCGRLSDVSTRAQNNLRRVGSEWNELRTAEDMKRLREWLQSVSVEATGLDNRAAALREAWPFATNPSLALNKTRLLQSGLTSLAGAAAKELKGLLKCMELQSPYQTIKTTEFYGVANSDDPLTILPPLVFEIMTTIIREQRSMESVGFVLAEVLSRQPGYWSEAARGTVLQSFNKMKEPSTISHFLWFMGIPLNHTLAKEVACEIVNAEQRRSSGAMARQHGITQGSSFRSSVEVLFDNLLKTNYEEWEGASIFSESFFSAIQAMVKALVMADELIELADEEGLLGVPSSWPAPLDCST